MAHNTPDGMGADRHREVQNMKESRQDPLYEFSYELAALDRDGEEVYRTEAFHTEEEAQDHACELNSEIPDRIPDEVVRFVVVEYDHSR
jgi:hypothetical protein